MKKSIHPQYADPIVPKGDTPSLRKFLSTLFTVYAVPFCLFLLVAVLFEVL